jgi:hypothetical protein
LSLRCSIVTPSISTAHVLPFSVVFEAVKYSSLQAFIQLFSSVTLVDYFLWLIVNIVKQVQLTLTFFFINNAMCFRSTFSNFYEKWVTYILANGPHLCVFLRSHTYDGDPPSTPCHKLIMILLHDPNDPTSSLSESFSSSANYDGVFGSSSSCSSVPSFCFTSVS